MSVAFRTFWVYIRGLKLTSGAENVSKLKCTMWRIRWWQWGRKNKYTLVTKASLVAFHRNLSARASGPQPCLQRRGHRIIPCHTIRCSTVQYSTVQYSTVQYCTVQYSTVQYSTVPYRTVPYRTVEYSTGQDRTGQDRTGPDRTGQYNIVQYSTVQYCTVQYSSIVWYRLV